MAIHQKPTEVHPRYITVRAASRALGVPYHSLLRAVSDGILPSYAPFNTRRYVILSEIAACIASHRSGGLVDE